MEKETIIEVLKKWNFWEKDIDAGIRRQEYVKKIHPYLERREIIVLKGIRRSGKSTIMKQLMYELTKNKAERKQILYLNLEDYNFANDLNIGFFDKILSAYLSYSKNKKKIYFFIDEIQKIEGWEKWIRTEYDLKEDIKFIISGSTASLLSRDLSALLTGRNLSFKIMPLSFREFLKFSKNKSLNEYLLFGGFPEVVLEKNEDRKLLILQQYFEDIVHKDIIDRYGIRNAKQLMDLARYLISVAGSKVSYNKLSRIFGISNDAIAMYVGYMIDAFLIIEVPYFSYSIKIRHDVTKLPKLYVIDNGLINTVNIKYSKNRGQMFENAALIKLFGQSDEVSYWSELRSEVDFIVGNTAINVTATDKIHKRELQGLDDFHAGHKHFSLLLITESMNENNIISLVTFLTKFQIDTK